MKTDQDIEQTLNYVIKKKNKIILFILALFMLSFGSVCILMPEELVNDSSTTSRTNRTNRMITNHAFGTIQSTQISGYCFVGVGIFFTVAAISIMSTKVMLSADESNLYIGNKKQVVIAWKDISELQIIPYMNIELLALIFHNPEEWIDENAKNKLDRLKMKNNLSQRGSPMLTVVNVYNKSPQEICEELNAWNQKVS